ncbi:Long-chain-fatty-acid--CoA ligase [Phycisphaerae bacterium RAS1]|nr:Long-chain-fatty-acid--CoA ligase [Phycisphaerae bacterium RAS1]
MHFFLDRFEATVRSRREAPAACDQSLVTTFESFRALACGVGGVLLNTIDAGSRGESEPRASASGAPSTAPLRSRLGKTIAGGADGERHIGILLPTSAAAAVSIFGCWYAGLTPVPLNFMLPPDELKRIVADAGITLIVTIERFAPLAEAAGATPLVLSGKTTLIPGELAAPPADKDQTAVILYTSGTSGDPKGVCLSFDNLVSNALACIEHAGITPDQSFLSVLPQFHSFGFTAMTVTPLLLGATVHYLPRFTPAAILDTVSEKHISVFMGVASMYGVLLGMSAAEPAMFASLRLAVSGGEPLPDSIADGFEQRFGVRIMQGYGLTETSPVATLNTPAANRHGSVGRPLPGVRVWAADEAGRDRPAGQEGELIVAGHCVMKGYHNKPETTAAALLGDGSQDRALRTGDIGRVDADGYVFITGRAKEMMIVAGENVFPGEIERVLATHPAVAEAAVIGVRSERHGERPVAFVVLREAAAVDAAALQTYCRERLAGYKVPREVYFAADFPRAATGKIMKRLLRPPG